MKVEVVSISTELLVSDIIDTNAAHITRKLREVNLDLTCKITVGDDLEMIKDVLRSGQRRADVILTVGGLGAERRNLALRAVAAVSGRPFYQDTETVDGAQLLSGNYAHTAGWLVEEPRTSFICLPGKRQELAYLLEANVFPYLRRHVPDTRHSDWLLLRTVGIMESSLKEKLADLPMKEDNRLAFDSFAGQTSIRVWTEGESETAVVEKLTQFKQMILERLGDYVYGEEEDRLENVIVRMLERSQIHLAVAECYTGGALAHSLQWLSGAKHFVAAIEQSCEALARRLQLDEVTAQTDLTRWCRQAAECLLSQTEADLGLVVYNHKTPGGIQTLVTLASPLGVSVTQRSFGGHPENIDQWVCTLGLAHLRRWLLVHG